MNQDPEAGGQALTGAQAHDFSDGKENVERIRDLLFGPQVRSFNNRFNRLEERLVREITDMRDDVRKRVDALELFMKNELKTLVGRVTQEQEKRSEAVRSLKGDIKGISEAFEEKLSQLDNQVEETAKDLREQLLYQSKGLTEEISKKHDEALSVAQEWVDRVRLEYVDRANLSRLFTETAVRLNANLARDLLPGQEDVGDE
ncbi:MAG: hypothetical protein V2B18_20035 [Pseudomonadota bacterium]